MAQWKKEALVHKGKVKGIPGKVLADSYSFVKSKKAKAAAKEAAKKAQHAKGVQHSSKEYKAAMDLEASTWFPDELGWTKDMEKLSESAVKMSASSSKLGDAAKALGKALVKGVAKFKPGTMVYVTLLDAAGDPMEVHQVPIKGDGTIDVPENPHGGELNFSYEWQQLKPVANFWDSVALTGAEITLGGKVQAPPEGWVKKPAKAPTAEEMGHVDITAPLPSLGTFNKVHDEAMVALSKIGGLMTPELSDKFMKQLMDTPSLLKGLKSNPLAKKIKLGPGKLMFAGKEMGDASMVPALYTDQVTFFGKSFILGYLIPKGNLHIQFGNACNMVVNVGIHPMSKVKWMFEHVIMKLDTAFPQWKGWPDESVADKLQSIFAQEPWYEPGESWYEPGVSLTPLKPFFPTPPVALAPQTWIPWTMPTLEVDYDHQGMVYSFAVRASDKSVYVGKVDYYTLLDQTHLSYLLKIGKKEFEKAMETTFNHVVSHMAHCETVTAKQLWDLFSNEILKL